MNYLARDLGRSDKPEDRALWSKYNAGQASAELTLRVFALQSMAITPDEDHKYRDLLKKNKEQDHELLKFQVPHPSY